MIDWQPLQLDDNKGIPQFSATTKRAKRKYKRWTLTHYTMPPESFMAHKGGKVLRAKSEKELLSLIDATTAK